MAEWILHRPRVKGRNSTYKCSNCGKLCSSYYNDVGEWKCCPHCMTPITRTPKERGGRSETKKEKRKYYRKCGICGEKHEQSEMIRTDNSPNGWICFDCHNAEYPEYAIDEW